jgi:hypothetical protein
MKKWLIFVALIIAVGAGGLWYWKRSNNLKNQATNQSAQETKVTVTVEDGENKQNYEVSYQQPMTALEVTKQATDGKVTTKGEGTMAFVTGINGRNVDENKHEFWEFLVNGEQVKMGAGTYVVQKQDMITWKITTY